MSKAIESTLRIIIQGVEKSGQCLNLVERLRLSLGKENSEEPKPLYRRRDLQPQGQQGLHEVRVYTENEQWKVDGGTFVLKRSGKPEI